MSARPVGEDDAMTRTIETTGVLKANETPISPLIELPSHVIYLCISGLSSPYEARRRSIVSSDTCGSSRSPDNASPPAEASSEKVIAVTISTIATPWTSFFNNNRSIV